MYPLNPRYVSNKYPVHVRLYKVFNKVSDMSDVILELLQSEGAQDEPELQRPEPAAQRDLPVLRTGNDIISLS